MSQCYDNSELLCLHSFKKIMCNFVTKGLEIFKKMFSVSRLLKKDNWPSWVKSCINFQKNRKVGYARKPMIPLIDKEIIEIKDVLNIL